MFNCKSDYDRQALALNVAMSGEIETTEINVLFFSITATTFIRLYDAYFEPHKMTLHEYCLGRCQSEII